MEEEGRCGLALLWGNMVVVADRKCSGGNLVMGRVWRVEVKG